MNRLEKSGKITQNTGKQGISDKYYLIFLYIIFSDIEIKCVLFAKMYQVFSKENKTLKKYWKIWKKYWKSQGILSVRKSWNAVTEIRTNITLYCRIEFSVNTFGLKISLCVNTPLFKIVYYVVEKIILLTLKFGPILLCIVE